MKTSSFILMCLLIVFTYNNISAQDSYVDLVPSLDNQRSIIFEGGSLLTQVRTMQQPFNTSPSSVTREERPTRFSSESLGWTKAQGFTAGIKFATTINPQLFDSDISLDFISGLVYKETNITQQSYSPHQNGSMGFFIECFAFYWLREVNIKSIEIPLELRSNIQLGNFTFSPILGLAVDVPVSRTHHLFYQEFNDAGITKGEFNETEKFESPTKFNYSTISKLEVAYQLANQHKIKIAAFYNMFIIHALDYQLSDRDAVSTKGFQIAYEIPLTNIK